MVDGDGCGTAQISPAGMRSVSERFVHSCFRLGTHVGRFLIVVVVVVVLKREADAFVSGVNVRVVHYLPAFFRSDRSLIRVTGVEVSSSTHFIFGSKYIY